MAMTTCKHRQADGLVKRTVDYIFLQKNEYYQNKTVHIIQYQNPSDIDRDGNILDDIYFPCHNHPSDHFSSSYIIQIEK